MAKTSDRMAKSLACVIQGRNLNVVSIRRSYQCSSRMSARVAHSKEVQRMLATRKDWKTTRRRPCDLQLACFYRCCHLLTASKMAPYSITSAGLLDLGLQQHNFRYSARKEDQSQQATKFRNCTASIVVLAEPNRLVVAAHHHETVD
jgi:hypothetical protein